jgi:HPt (histidine-containing phosphotransfer) domain-containing protein
MAPGKLIYFFLGYILKISWQLKGSSMEQMTKKLKEHRIDTDGVIARLGGKENLYLTICKKFLYDISYPTFWEAVNKGDFEEARKHIHTLKGVAVNLGFIYLSSLCNRLLIELEQQNFILFNKDLLSLSQEYDIIISILNENF